MKQFKFHWLDGSITNGTGETVEQAYTNAGYSNGAKKVLDYWELVEEPQVLLNDDLIREAVNSALAVIDRSIPAANRSSGPLGDALANTLHKAIQTAIEDYKE